jgi:hypothetical protein
MTDTTTFGPCACFEVSDADDNHVGYWRNRATAHAIAEEIGGIVRELDPPDFIACEDDEGAVQ